MCIYSPWLYFNRNCSVKKIFFFFNWKIVLIFIYIYRHIYEDAGTVDKLMFNICKNFFQTPKGGSDCTVYCCLEDHEKLVKGAYYIDS